MLSYKDAIKQELAKIDLEAQELVLGSLNWKEVYWSLHKKIRKTQAYEEALHLLQSMEVKQI